MLRRFHHDRNVGVRIGVIDSIRRIRKAPTPYCLCRPPPWYTAEDLQRLTARAIDTVRNVWPDRWERARRREEAMERVEGRLKQKRQKREASEAAHAEKVKQIRGGFVGADDERRQLEAGELLDLAGFETIVWTQSSRQTKWTADAVKGQLWLRNLRRDGWSEELRAALGNAGLLHQGKIKGMGESAQQVQQTLKRVLEVERTVAAAADAADTSSESVDADQQPEPGEEEAAELDAALAGDKRPAAPRRSARARKKTRR